MHVNTGFQSKFASSVFFAFLITSVENPTCLTRVREACNPLRKSIFNLRFNQRDVINLIGLTYVFVLPSFFSPCVRLYIVISLLMIKLPLDFVPKPSLILSVSKINCDIFLFCFTRTYFMESYMSVCVCIHFLSAYVVVVTFSFSFSLSQVPLLFASIGILATTFTICVFIKCVSIWFLWNLSGSLPFHLNHSHLRYYFFLVSFPLRFFLLSLSLSFFIHRFNHTPVIMASGRELCYVLLTGVCLCYVMTFIILARPTVIRCACMRVGLGLCLSLCYSAIFVKTNRISRIFNCGVKAVSRPIYTSPISQIAICLCTWELSPTFFFSFYLKFISFLFSIFDLVLLFLFFSHILL